jgi:ADP-L-glycero-D-manno-heptose 6-epimerase
MILVTGGSGFIGSNLVAALSESGAGPIVVCDTVDSAERQGNLAKHNVVEIVPPDGLFDWLAADNRSVDAIFHLGASSSTTEKDFNYLLDNNFGVSQGLWKWCAERDTQFIYASSAATYGDGALGFDDANEVAALSQFRPLNPYGWSKQLFDVQAVLLDQAGYRPRQWAGLKFFNVYGPNEYHKGPQQSVAVQLHDQISKSGQVRLFKSHHPDFEDGGQMRDFIWVDDCVDIMLWLFDNPTVSGIFNCGTGKARSFRDLALACFAATETEPEIDYINTPTAIRDQYQYFTEAKMDRLRNAGYDRPFTSLEDGAARYIREFLNTNDRYR